MTTLHEAAQKALELCERIRDAREVWSMGELRSVCLNLRSALAQQGPVGDAEKAKNLLSLTVGCLMRYEEGKHNLPYKAGSATANMVNDVVEYLQDWPKTAPAPQAQQGEQQPVGYWGGEFSNDGGATLYKVPQESLFGRKYVNIPLYAGAAPAAQPDKSALWPRWAEQIEADVARPSLFKKFTE